MSVKITCNGHDIEPGVVLESSRGIYATTAMIQIAEILGFPLDAGDRAMMNAYDDGDSSAADYVLDPGGLADAAEAWLNDHTMGGFWHWYDGDFRVDEDCPNDWADCDDEECWTHSDL